MRPNGKAGRTGSHVLVLARVRVGGRWGLPGGLVWKCSRGAGARSRRRGGQAPRAHGLDGGNCGESSVHLVKDMAEYAGILMVLTIAVQSHAIVNSTRVVKYDVRGQARPMLK